MAIAEIERSQRRLFRACTLKDQFPHPWEDTFSNAGARAQSSVASSHCAKFVRMVDAHWDGTVASLSGITNAVDEGLD